MIGVARTGVNAHQRELPTEAILDIKDNRFTIEDARSDRRPERDE